MSKLPISGRISCLSLLLTGTVKEDIIGYNDGGVQSNAGIVQPRAGVESGGCADPQFSLEVSCGIMCLN